MRASNSGDVTVLAVFSFFLLLTLVALQSEGAGDWIAYHDYCKLEAPRAKPVKTCVKGHCHPYFLILGAPKAGTTFLAHHLMRHPQIVRSKNKEIGYFDRYYAKRKFDWYVDQFPKTSPSDELVSFEATSRNMLYPHLIKNHLPNARFILLLRDPAERFYSHYGMELRKGFNFTLEDVATRSHRRYEKCTNLHPKPEHLADLLRCLGKMPKLYLFGCYARLLEAWYKWYPTRQILILSHEELTEDPVQALDKVTTFLNLPKCSWADGQYTAINRNKVTYHNSDNDAFMTTVRKWYRPMNEQLEIMLNRTFGWA